MLAELTDALTALSPVPTGLGGGGVPEIGSPTADWRPADEAETCRELLLFCGLAFLAGVGSAVTGLTVLWRHRRRQREETSRGSGA